MDNIDNVSPSLGAIVDAFCRNNNDHVTRTFTTYIKMLRCHFRKDEVMVWIDEELEELLD